MYAGYGDYEGKAGDRKFRLYAWNATPAKVIHSRDFIHRYGLTWWFCQGPTW